MQSEENCTGKTIAAIVPNYNYSDFILERIDSILSQTYPINELIILDDASTDDSVSVIEEKILSIRKDYPSVRVKFVKNKENSGGCVFSQWQKGLREVQSDYFWIAEADDSANKHFIEIAMQKFKEYPSAVLFYSDSKRIDQKGRVISETCSDWADMWGEGRWNSDFYNDGKDEVINYLGETNPILNVSSVVWKKTGGLMKIFDEAKDYKVAGDWYIYTRVLEHGDVAYSAKPLNYYRKHNKGSASTVVKFLTEYKEIVMVQERVAKKYKLNRDNIEWQKYRRRGMGATENKKNNGKRGKIAWLVPDFNAGSGGHRTIFQNINYLIDLGYKCDMYVKTLKPMLPVEIFDNVKKWYGEFKGDVFNDYELIDEYDIVFATGWETVEYAAKMNCKEKLYFIQDYEPWFFPMGQDYLAADESYKYGLNGISIGNWLPAKLRKEHNLNVNAFSFGADLDKYKRLKDTKKEDAICFIFQPGKPRRCADLGLKALQMVRTARPQTKVYLFGSKKMGTYVEEVEHLGILSVEECNEMYNKCKVGLCFSASNPSRIPFEMMAAGLPVVDLHLENNLYDFPEGGCLLAEPRAESIAGAILKILDDDDLRKKMSKKGEAFMKKFPLTRGFEEFGEMVERIIDGKKLEQKECVRMYKSDAFVEIGKLEVDEDMEICFKPEKTADQIWRENLTIPQRIYLKIRYILTGR